MLASSLAPKVNLVSSLIITWPAPLVTNLISPSVLFEYIVFPSTVRLSTVQLSTLGKV